MQEPETTAGTAADRVAESQAIEARLRRKILLARLTHRALVLACGAAVSWGMHGLDPVSWSAHAAWGTLAGMLFAMAALEVRFGKRVQHEDIPQLLTQELAMLEQCFTILRKQVSVTIKSSESAVLDVVGRLDNVHQLSHSLHQEVVNAVSHSQGLSADSLTDASRNSEALETLERTQAEFLQARQENQQRIGAVADQVRQLTPLAALISDISRQTNLLAINAAIEAARAGPEGAGFKVVAAEVRRLSAQTDEAARQISQGILTVAQSIDTELVTANRIDTEQGAEKLAELTQTVVQMIDKLAQVVPYLSNLSKDMQVGMDTVSSDIVAALGHMQFQDINRQLLEQVEVALDSLSAHASALYAVVGHNAPPPPQQLRDLMARWSSNYVMHEQRLAHDETMGHRIPSGVPAVVMATATLQLDESVGNAPRIELF